MTATANIRRQLLNALKRGTGEAYLIVKNKPGIDFSNQIIKGALNIYAYDGQCEGNRAQYIFDIIAISNQKEKIRKAVFQGLATEQADTWNLTHLFALTKLYAQENDLEAKQAIYERFLNHPIEYADWVGASEILAMDGLEGLFYIAEKFGKYIEQNPDDRQDDGIISLFQEANPSIKVYKELEKKARTNTSIHSYLENIKQTKANQKKHKTEPIKYKDIIDEILNKNPAISLRRKKNLTEEEIQRVAQHLIVEKDQSNIERLLHIFYAYKFPYDSQIILNFAQQKPTSKNRIVEFAIDALKHLESENVRNFALDKIRKSKNPIDYLELLIANYKNGDEQLLSQIANKTNNEHKIEQLAGIYTAIYKANPVKECKAPLEILYNKMNCAIHRNGIVALLIENEVLSDKIKEEIKFDCDLETRKLLK